MVLVLRIWQMSCGLFEEKTKVLPCFEVTSTAFPKDVVYAYAPSKLYRRPTPPNLLKDDFTAVHDTTSSSNIDVWLNQPNFTERLLESIWMFMPLKFKNNNRTKPNIAVDNPMPTIASEPTG